MDKRTSSRIKRISLQQEKRAAASIGGRTQAASGATRLGGGGDVRRMLEIKLECKFTEKDHYVIKKTELEKLRLQAAKTLEMPVFQFGFRSRLGRMDLYAVTQGFDLREGETPLLLESFTNSYTVFQDKLRKSLSEGRVRLSFRDGNAPKLWEIMHWHTFEHQRGEV